MMPRPRLTGPRLCKGPCGIVHPEESLRHANGEWVGRCVPCRRIQKNEWMARKRREPAWVDQAKQYRLRKMREHWEKFGHQLLRFRRGPGCRTCVAWASSKAPSAAMGAA